MNKGKCGLDTPLRPYPTGAYKVAKKPQLVCDLPALTPGPSGSENNPVGSGRSVFVASTYGYP